MNKYDGQSTSLSEVRAKKRLVMKGDQSCDVQRSGGGRICEQEDAGTPSRACPGRSGADTWALLV